MQSDQQLFAKGLAAYRKVMDLNYMAHKEVYDLVRRLLVAEATPRFTFLDLGCGTASGSAEALKGTGVGRYVGVDISAPSLKVAKRELEVLNCPVELHCQDFVQAVK